ncbi:hypothetical protein TorRG33x02_101930 [Trema orientale]|uniref:Uncharacterized protein n=1 Tax=Trema orientale TaxID=63057 RepID=A0A2P5F8R2_TREOI|nr:hypothetical protein TorRG33x02_101930 [Trema orientale]
MTLFIEGRSQGFNCMHHNATMIIFFVVFISSSLTSSDSSLLMSCISLSCPLFLSTTTSHVARAVAAIKYEGIGIDIHYLMFCSVSVRLGVILLLTLVSSKSCISVNIPIISGIKSRKLM